MYLLDKVCFENFEIEKRQLMSNSEINIWFKVEGEQFYLKLTSDTLEPFGVRYICDYGKQTLLGSLLYEYFSYNLEEVWEYIEEQMGDMLSDIY